MILLDILSICIAIGYEGARIDTSNKGIFGYMRTENLFSCFFLYGFMAGFWGVCGYVIACKYFPPVVIMNCLLVEPVLGQVIGVYMKIDHKPGAMTFIGVFVIIVAINII